jgi:acyl-coenzyme A thioesterase PaaI-like protein
MMSNHILKWLSLYPPFLGAGIRVKHAAPGFRSIDVEMKLRFWNRNYVGTQFGGSLYAMTDPFLMLMLIENLGRDYIVWDKAAAIRFKRPGKGTVRAHFELTEERIAEIRAQADREPKVEPVFEVQVVDDEGTVVAEVQKTLYVKRKR